MVSLSVEIVNPNLAKAHTTLEYYVKSPLDLDKITKEIENHPLGLKVMKIETARPLTDLYPGCNMHGAPKIEKKNTRDYRERTWRNKEETPRKERPPEFWLTLPTQDQKSAVFANM